MGEVPSKATAAWEIKEEGEVSDSESLVQSSHYNIIVLVVLEMKCVMQQPPPPPRYLPQLRLQTRGEPLPTKPTGVSIPRSLKHT